MKILYCIFFVVCFVLLGMGSVSAMDRDDVYSELSNYLYFKKGNLSETEKLEELKVITNSINSELDQTPNDAELLLLKGLAYCSYLYAKENQSLEDNAEFKSSCQQYLNQAIEKNKIDKTLSYHQLVTLKAYSGPDLAVKAIDQILATDYYFDDKERVEMRRNKISHLIRLSRFDEALGEMQFLNEKFPEFASVEWDDAFLGEIEKAKKLKGKAVEVAKEVHAPEVESAPVEPSISVSKPKSVSSLAEPSPKVKVDEGMVAAENSKLWYLMLVALGLVAVFIMLVRRR